MRSAADTAGSLLGAVFGGLAALRRRKPLHPDGSVLTARVVRHGLSDPVGAAWLDEPGEDEALVRTSRSVGLPPGWPDVLGLAVRLTGGGDLLLASTGESSLGRFVLLPGRDPEKAFYSSLFPYRTVGGGGDGGGGMVLLGARPTGSAELDLLVATMRGEWRPYGRLLLDADPDGRPDAPVDLDPVLHPLPGLRLPTALAALREPAYAAARAGRTVRTG